VIRLPDRPALRRLAVAGAAVLALRLAVIAWLPDADTDSYGHFAVARTLVAEPTNLVAHWVWLPFYHYVLWALIHAGIGFTGVRVLNALLQAAAPFLLHDFVARRDGDDRLAENAGTAEVAALAWTLAPLPNLLATAAQQETTFALLVLATAWAIERRRFALSGTLLAGACLIRYEAWGAVALLALTRLLRGRRGPGLASFLVPALAVAVWITLRRRVDGEWLLFVRQTREFAGGVRGTLGFSPLVDALWFPVILPAAVLGPALLLVPFGVRRSLRAGWVVPAGILAFLWASYAGRGALGLDRYYTALVPFACVAVADGAKVVAERLKKGAGRVQAAAVIALAVTTGLHVRWLVRRSVAKEAELRGYEAKVTGPVERR
jgi:hypothetical protein